jgi:hypothetical protein
VGTVLRMRKSRAALPAKAHRYPLAEFHLDTVPIQEMNVDGEIMGSTPVTLRVIPQALRVVVGEERPGDPPLPWKKWLLAGSLAAGVAAGAVLLRKAQNPPSTDEDSDQLERDLVRN